MLMSKINILSSSAIYKYPSFNTAAQALFAEMLAEIEGLEGFEISNNFTPFSCAATARISPYKSKFAKLRLLVPDITPRFWGLEGFEIFGRCEPASEVGGDFYDFISLDGRSQVGVAVADVSGKQMQGAMNAVMANGILHLATTETEDTSPSSIVEKANAILTARMKQDTNITMIFGFLNSENRSFNFVNAGHHAHPILVRNGTVSRVEQSGFPLGMKYPMRYKSHQFQFESGDLLLLMSDGIIEPTDENGVMYAETGKLETSLSNIPPNTPLSGILDMLIQDVKRHAINSIEPQDDITLIGIRATG